MNAVKPTYDRVLSACQPAPLASYLKGLGILRIVTEQADSNCRGFWRDGTFVLRTSLTSDELLEFLLEKYSPAPIVGPWGARSGFYPGSSEAKTREALDRISACDLVRVKSLRRAIACVWQLLRQMGVSEKPEDEGKRDMLIACRAALPDEVLAWLDVAYVVASEKPRFPPLLGTGGNEGNASYMLGFVQQVVEVLIERKWDRALRPALFGDCADQLATDQTPGHFSPESSGGPNSTQGFDGKVMINPWDYLFLLEGSLLFAAASVKRLEDRSHGAMSAPFCVRATGAGFGSATEADAESARAEMWLPMWDRPATFAELKVLFSEGRANVGKRVARNGVDFARAVTSLGTDRGLTAFQRYGFHQRNGLSFFAIPLGTYFAKGNSIASLLDGIDDWLVRFAAKTSGDRVPQRVKSARRTLELSILQLCREGGQRELLEVLVALGLCQRALYESVRWAVDQQLAPVPPLALDWAELARDDSAEFALAASIASIDDDRIGPLREHMWPLEVFAVSGRPVSRWLKHLDSPTLVWTGRDLVRDLCDTLRRRVLEGTRESSDCAPLRGAVPAHLGDIQGFIAGDTDDRRLSSLVDALALIDWRSSDVRRGGLRSGGRLRVDELPPPSPYAILKLLHLPARPSVFPQCPDGIPVNSQITQLAVTGRIEDASRLAARRLASLELTPKLDAVGEFGYDAYRIAAALAFPLSRDSVAQLGSQVLRRPPPEPVAQMS